MLLPEAAVAVIDASLNFVYSFQPLVEKTLVLGTFGGCRLWWNLLLNIITNGWDPSF